eukprot:5693104-Lingulodinium_polyedra.AAC.1
MYGIQRPEVLRASQNDIANAIWYERCMRSEFLEHAEMRGLLLACLAHGACCLHHATLTGYA